MALKVGMNLGLGTGLGRFRAGVADGFGSETGLNLGLVIKVGQNEFGVRISLGLKLR